MNKPSAQQIRSWIHRQRTLGTPSPAYLKWLRTQYRLTCVATVIAASSVTGCAAVNQAVCYGAGTCGSTGIAVANTNTTTTNTLPQTVQLPNGNVLVVRDVTSGSISAIIPVSRTK